MMLMMQKLTSFIHKLKDRTLGQKLSRTVIKMSTMGVRMNHVGLRQTSPEEGHFGMIAFLSTLTTHFMEEF